MAYCAVDDVKAYMAMNTTDVSKDDLITDLIAAAESFINEYCGRIFGKSTITEYFSDKSNKVFVANYPMDRSKPLRIWDSWDRLYADTDLIPSSDYFVDWDRGIITFDYEIGGTPGSVKVEYTGGGDYKAPPIIKQACIELVARKFKEGPSGGLLVAARSSTMGGSVSYIVADILPQTKMALDMLRK